MESTRQQKFSKLIQKELSSIFIKDQKHLFENQPFITITIVRVTPDLKLAKIYLSILLSKNKEETLAAIREKTKAIRQLLASKIKNQCRSIPALEFYLDDSIEYAEKMNKLINDLDIPPTDESEEKDKDN